METRSVQLTVQAMLTGEEIAFLERELARRKAEAQSLGKECSWRTWRQLAATWAAVGLQDRLTDERHRERERARAI